MTFSFNKEKNEKLILERGVSFQNIIEAISEGKILLNIKHPNSEAYPNQWMFIMEYRNYTFSVPYVKNGNELFLKTIFPNRKYMYLLDGGYENE